MPFQRILLIQLRQLGDILLTTPCIRAIKDEHPGAHITFLCHRMGAVILRDNPHVDELLLYHETDSWKESFHLIKHLRQSSFDLVIDFMNNPRSAFLSLLSGAPVRCAQRSARALAYTKLVERTESSDYVVREKFRLLAACGFHPKDISLSMPWSDADLKPWQRLLSANPSLGQAPIRVLLSPTHRRPARRWPPERYAALADRLHRDWHASVVWVWGPGEEEEIDQWRSLCKEPTLKIPATTLRELTALMAQHDLFIGNSNGPSHLAVAANICSLQLHGHTRASSWCPSTEQHRAVQSPSFYTASTKGANKGANKEPITLDPISLEQVWQELEAMRPNVLAQAHKRRLQK